MPRKYYEDKKLGLREVCCDKHLHYLAGSAMTSGECEDGGYKISHPNTMTPKWCISCADKGNKCRYCGLDIEHGED